MKIRIKQYNQGWKVERMVNILGITFHRPLLFIWASDKYAAYYETYEEAEAKILDKIQNEIRNNSDYDDYFIHEKMKY